jgi:hypothetical protein
LEKIRLSGTAKTPAKAFDRLLLEEKERMADVIPVHRGIARGDPVGRFEDPDRPVQGQIGFFEKGRRPDPEGDGKGIDGAREDGILINQMIIRGLADSRALQKGVEGSLLRLTQPLDVLP